MGAEFTSVAEYLDSFPDPTRDVLEQIRRIVHGVVPDGEDAISYDIATVRVQGRPVVHYGGWKQHVSLYPVPEGDEQLQRDLAPYVAGKGTCTFALSEPLPSELVGRLVTQLWSERGPSPH